MAPEVKMTPYEKKKAELKKVEAELHEILDVWIEINGHRVHKAREYRHMWE
jgi:hypothetical protein